MQHSRTNNIDDELVYSEQRKDETWKQIIEYLEGNTQSDAHNLPKKNIEIPTTQWFALSKH